MRLEAGWLLLLLACSGTSEDADAPAGGDADADADADTDTDTDADTDTASDTAGTETGSTGSTADTGPEPVDCSILPPVPLTFYTRSGFGTAEDFDFNAAGEHISVKNNQLFARDSLGNDLGPRSAAIGGGGFGDTSGTRALANGDYVVNVPSNGATKLITAGGGVSILAGGMEYPNGLEVGFDGYVYVAEQDANRLRQIDPNTGDQWIVAQGLTHANGVILSDDEQTAYVGSFGDGKIWAIDRISDHEWDPPRVIAESNGPDGGFDGINVDICGNVYFTEYVTGKVWRISNVDGAVQMAADLPSGWIPNMRWGHEIGDWRSDVLYVSDRNQGRLFALETLIPGKRHILNP